MGERNSAKKNSKRRAKKREIKCQAQSWGYDFKLIADAKIAVST